MKKLILTGTGILLAVVLSASKPSRIAPASTNASIHFEHLRRFGQGLPIPNQLVLKAVDSIQSRIPEGGGYFIGVRADPPECPIGLPLQILGRPLLTPTRPTSYCSGASYAALIEALNFYFEGDSSLVPAVPPSSITLTDEQIEAIRMQEPDGGRREDMVKLWGWWNADGPGSLYALTGFSQMGQRVSPAEALPGDFCNINWVKGPGHSVVFLGWENTTEGAPGMRFWSSQKSTNGLSDLTVPLSSIDGVVFTRLTTPSALQQLDPTRQLSREKIQYDKISAAIQNIKKSKSRTAI